MDRSTRIFSIAKGSWKYVAWRPIYTRNMIVRRTLCIDLHRHSCAQFAARISIAQSVVNAKKPTILLPSRNDVGSEAVFEGRQLKQHVTLTTALQSTHIG